MTDQRSEPALRWNEAPATKQVSAFGLTRGRSSRWTYDTALDKGKSAYTPPAFRDVLLNMARTANVPAFVCSADDIDESCGQRDLEANTKPVPVRAAAASSKRRAEQSDA